MSDSTVSRSARRTKSECASCACTASTWSPTFRTSPLRAQPAVSARIAAVKLRTERRADVLRLLQRIATRENREFIAAVLRPGILVVAGVERPLLAVRDGLDAAGIDPMAHEILLGGVGAAIAQGEVVFVGPALVTVAGDLHPQRRILLQYRDLLVERLLIAGENVRLVEIEVDHHGERRLHLVARLGEGRERIRRPLPRDAVRFLLRPAGGIRLRLGERVSAPLALAGRVRGGDGRRRGIGFLAAGRDGAGRRECRQNEQLYAVH